MRTVVTFLKLIGFSFPSLNKHIHHDWNAHYKSPAVPPSYHYDRKLRELAKILDLPFTMVEPTGEQGLAAMSMAIMYRHLDRRQRYDAMQVIHSLDNKDLVNKLQTKAIDTALVNKRWGVWSMTNEELLEDQEFHN